MRIKKRRAKSGLRLKRLLAKKAHGVSVCGKGKTHVKVRVKARASSNAILSMTDAALSPTCSNGVNGGLVTALVPFDPSTAGCHPPSISAILKRTKVHGDHDFEQEKLDADLASVLEFYDLGEHAKGIKEYGFTARKRSEILAQIAMHGESPNHRMQAIRQLERILDRNMEVSGHRRKGIVTQDLGGGAHARMTIDAIGQVNRVTRLLHQGLGKDTLPLYTVDDSEKEPTQSELDELVSANRLSDDTKPISEGLHRANFNGSSDPVNSQSEGKDEGKRDGKSCETKRIRFRAKGKTKNKRRKKRSGTRGSKTKKGSCTVEKDDKEKDRQSHQEDSGSGRRRPGACGPNEDREAAAGYPTGESSQNQPGTCYPGGIEEDASGGRDRGRESDSQKYCEPLGERIEGEEQLRHLGHFPPCVHVPGGGLTGVPEGVDPYRYGESWTVDIETSRRLSKCSTNEGFPTGDSDGIHEDFGQEIEKGRDQAGFRGKATEAKRIGPVVVFDVVREQTGQEEENGPAS